MEDSTLLSINTFLPKPIVDIVKGPALVREQEEKWGKKETGLFQTSYYVSQPAAKMVKAVFRVALAAAGAIALSQLSLTAAQTALTLAASTFVSLPATLILCGSMLAYYGTTALISAFMASGPLAAFGMGAASLGAGIFAIQRYDHRWYKGENVIVGEDLGIAEKLNNQVANLLRYKVAQACL